MITFRWYIKIREKWYLVMVLTAYQSLGNKAHENHSIPENLCGDRCGIKPFKKYSLHMFICSYVHRDQINNLTVYSIDCVKCFLLFNQINSCCLTFNQAPTVTWSRPVPVAHVGTASVPASVPISSLASFSLSPISAANSQNKTSDEQRVSLFRNFLEQMKVSSTVDYGCIPAVTSSVASPVVPTMLGLGQNPYIASRADTLLSTLPLFAPALGLTSKGKSAGDLAFSPPVKHPQLWPHQFVIK